MKLVQGTERRWVSDSCRVQDLGTDVSRRTAEAGRVEMMELSASGEIAADVEGADPNGAESAETSAVPSFPTSTEARSTRQACSLLQGTMVGQRYVLWVEGGLPASRRAIEPPASKVNAASSLREAGVALPRHV